MLERKTRTGAINTEEEPGAPPPFVSAVTGPLPRLGKRSPQAVARPCHPIALATVLTSLAGFLDAAAFIELNHLFVSFMSGNSTHLGIVLVSGSLPDILAVVTIIVAFVAGAGLGTWIADRAGSHRLTVVLSAEFLLFDLAIALAFDQHAHAALAMVAIAMGMQNVLHQVVAGADVGKGFITGALFGLGQSIARLFCDEGATKRAALNLLSWSSFVGGATVGALALTAFGLASCLILATLIIIVVILALLFGWA